MINVVGEYKRTDIEEKKQKSEIKSALEKIVDKTVSETKIVSKSIDFLNDKASVQKKEPTQIYEKSDRREYWRKEEFPEKKETKYKGKKESENTYSSKEAVNEEQVELRKKIDDRIKETKQNQRVNQVPPRENCGSTLSEQRCYELRKQLDMAKTMLLYDLISC